MRAKTLRCITVIVAALLAVAVGPTLAGPTVQASGTIYTPDRPLGPITLEFSPEGGPVKGIFRLTAPNSCYDQGKTIEATVTATGNITGELRGNQFAGQIEFSNVGATPGQCAKDQRGEPLKIPAQSISGTFDMARGTAQGSALGGSWKVTFQPATPDSTPTPAAEPGMTLAIEGGWQRVAADGVSKLRLVVQLPSGVATESVQFQMSIPDGPSGAAGMLSNKVEGGKSIATYEPPITLDKPFTVEVRASATTASRQTLQANTSFEVVHTPVLLIHGIWSDSEAWALGEELLEAWGFRYVSRYNYGSCNSCDPASRIEPNLDRQIQDPENGFLARVRKDKTLASRYDLVGHSLGGLVARQHVVTGDNYKQVRKVVTVGTPHLGSEFADWFLYFERSKTQNEKEQNPPDEVVSHPNWQSGPSGRNWDNDEFDWLKNRVRTNQKLDPSFFADGPAVDALQPKGDFLKKLNSADHHTDQISYYLIYGTSPLLSEAEVPALRDNLRTVSRAANEVMHDTFLDHVSNRGTDGVVSIESATGGWYRFDPEKGKVVPTDASEKRVPFKPKAVKGVAAHHVSIPSEAAALASLALRGDLDKPYVRFTAGKLQSPAHLHAYDDKGRHVGLDAQGKAEIGIPGAVYTGPEEATGVPETILIPDETPVRFEVKGYREGSFGLTARRSTGTSDQEADFEDVAIKSGQTALLKTEGVAFGDLETPGGKVRAALTANHQLDLMSSQPSATQLVSGQGSSAAKPPSAQPPSQPEKETDLAWIWWVGGAVAGAGLILLIQRARRKERVLTPATGSNSSGSLGPAAANRFCGRCGRRLPPNSRFCGGCGTRTTD